MVINLKRGRNELKTELVRNFFQSKAEDGEYFEDLLFSYKEQLLYTATDENYWCPTCEKIVRKHYDSDTDNSIKEIMSAYRNTMLSPNSTLAELIEANSPIIELLPSGNYVLSLRKILPTFGGDEIFSDFEDNSLKASVDSYYEYLGDWDHFISIDATTNYLLPTQTKESYSKETLNKYRQQDFLGRGLVLHFTGFLGCLLDGHHKATVAFERNEPLECLVIEPLINEVVYKAGTIFEGVDSLGFSHLPTIEEFCYMQQFIADNEFIEAQALQTYIESVISGKNQIEASEMEQLLVLIYSLFPSKLPELYRILTQTYLYRDLRYRYFDYLSKLTRTEQIEQLLLDYLINDDYEEKQLTKLCEDYFR